MIGDSVDASRRALSEHERRWGTPEIVSRAPGRVNLIGEHTDYNDGFALPMALPLDTVVALTTTGDPRSGSCHVVSEGYGEVVIDPARPQDLPPWAVHIGGVIEIGAAAGLDAAGWRAAIATDIPTGASLSSSAALEVALLTALAHRAGVDLSPIEIARLGQRIENEVVGLSSGIMDQFISAGAVEGHASLMDCRALTLSPVRLPDDVRVAVLDTGTRRVLATTAYDDRRGACRRAAEQIGVAALRDASIDDLVLVRDPVTRRRAHHVITENQRTLDARDALVRGDSVSFGELMDLSHRSLRIDYQVSGPGLDAMVETARSAPGCLGARMTGGGFAGCAVALVRADDAGAFVADVTVRYDYDDNAATIWMCAPAAGAGVVAHDR